MYGPNEIPVCIRSKLGTAGYPTGTRTVTFEAWVGGEYKKATCYFDVVEEAKEVKFRGKILTDSLIISFYSFDVKIDEVLDDPTGNLQEGETVNVYGHRSGPAQVDDVTVGDEIEVFGEYRGYVGTYEQILLTDSDHYVKKVEEKKPNLVIESILPDISNPKEGAKIKFTVRTKNKGEQDAGAFYIHYYIDGNYIDYDYISNGLSAGSIRSNYFYWTADRCGDVEVKAWADATDKVDEGSNEGDNTRTENVNIKCPTSDIIIENINWEPTNLEAGKPVDIEIIVRNQGKGKYVSPGNTHVDIKAIDKNNLIYGSAINEWESTEWNIGDLEVGERNTLVFKGFIFNIPYLAESLRVDLILAGDVDTSNNFREVSIPQVRHNDDDFYKCMIDGVLICLTSGMKTTAALEKAGKVAEAIKQTFSSAKFYKDLVEDLRQGRYEVFFSKIAKNKAEVIAQGDWGSGLIGDIKAKADKAYEFFDVFKNIIETGIACANVFEFYVDILEGWIRGGEDGGISSSGVVGASPIYILVEDEYGNKSGHDQSGAKMEEIEGSLVFTCDHFKTVLIPGKMDNKKVTVVGYDSEVVKSSKTISSTADAGTDSSFTLSIVESGKTVIYEDVPVNPQTIGTIEIDENNPDYYLELDYDGDGTTDDTVKPSLIKTIGCPYDHDGDCVVEDDIDDLIMATDAYLGFNTGVNMTTMVTAW